ncbi:hypothetical protein ElyMa_004611300 [Elysia marginata]|uniref:Uncharacterized protein n=1 Tax=Elysia marginata TaxID=1093978 RepID=A0AAV4HXY8_9GAST|nr:hypothetical protein ElyMa_004611300 [Elysia marginata]
MDGTDADGEWSDEELLRSGSQTGVSDDQDAGLSSGQDQHKAHRSSNRARQGDVNPAGNTTELTRPRHKNHHHRPSLGSIIKKMSSEPAADADACQNARGMWDTRGAPVVCMPVMTSFPPSAAAAVAGADSANLQYSAKLGSHNGSTTMMASAPDPVSAILDKIDAQIDAMDAKDMSVVPQLTNGAGKSSRLSKSSSSRSKSAQSGLNASGDTGLGSLHDSEFSDVDRSKVVSGPGEIFSEANLTDGLTDDERARRLDSDIPSDLDSVAAQQIDIKFKEIMRKKKATNEKKPDTCSCNNRNSYNNTNNKDNSSTNSNDNTQSNNMKTNDSITRVVYGILPDSPDEVAEEMAKFVRHILRRKSTGSCDLVKSSQGPTSRTEVSAPGKDGENSRSRAGKRENRSENKQLCCFQFLLLLAYLDVEF